jgi:flagellar hook-length control protein FliK
MKMENHRLKVEIVAENQNVKDALVHHLDTLKDTLSRQNIAMDRFNVLTGGGGNSSGSYREWRHTGQNAQPNPFVRFSGFSEETPQSNISYLDSSENSMVDLRL